MSLEETVIDGTLKPDGTLELDHKPTLAPGRVTVILRQHGDSAPPKESLRDFMQRTRRELEATDRTFMNEREVTAHVEWLREGDQIDEMLPQAADTNRPQEQP